MAKPLNVIPAKDAGHLPVVIPARYYDALKKGQHDLILDSMHQVLAYHEQVHFTSYDVSDLSRLDDLVGLFFSLLTNKDFKVGGRHGLNLIATQHIFCNLVASTPYKTTDGPLIHCLRQADNFFKVLFLCNQRCETIVEVKQFFDIEPNAASLWYTTYSLGTSNPTAVQLKNLQRHAEQMDERWVCPHRKISCQYFTTTYLAPSEDRRVKGLINQACKNRFKSEVKNNPNPKKIAIASAKWHRNHAVYKSAGPLVDQLKSEFDLTLIHLGEKVPENLVTEDFEQVVNAKFVGDELRLPPEVLDNNFCAIYYPDIGMNDECVWMSNSRIAPVQAMGYGHPATSGDNSEIDYFIGGDCEKGVGDRYGEQLVLIPGLAQAPVWPSYERKNNWTPNEKVVINCVWGPDKYNFATLSILAEVSKRAKTEHVWKFYPSPGIHRYGGFYPFLKSMKQVLPNCEVISELQYYEYMEAAEQGDFSVNSFPFGGYNTVVESLFLGLPIITIEGDRYYNRACSYLLREVGMDELSHTQAEEFIQSCVKMIDDEKSRMNYRDRLDSMDLRGILFKEDPDKHFLQAFKYILANHPIEKTDEPILIGASE